MARNAQAWTTASAVIAFMLSVFIASNAQTDFTDPLALIQSLANLPLPEQELMLMLAGTTLELQTGADCNLFAGPLSCKALPANSSYMQQCPGADNKVDCAFYGQVLDNVFDSPVDDLQGYLARQQWSPPAAACPQCFEKLQRMWCALASPRCGTFRAYTRLALLPALTSVVRAYNKGDSELEALADAVGGSIDAVGAALPCREMCEDLVATCGCSSAQSDTFGKLLEWMTAQAAQTGKAIPPAFQRLLFKRVWDRPFCSLFAPRASANFTGACSPDTAAACTARGQWCAAAPAAAATGGGGGAGGSAADGGGPDAVLRYVQGIVVLQLARAAAGWITDDAAGLWRTKAALSSPDSKQQLDELAANGSGPAGGPGLGGGQVAAVVVLTLLGAAMLAAAGVVGYRVYVHRRAESSYFELQSGGQFKPLSDDGI